MKPVHFLIAAAVISLGLGSAMQMAQAQSNPPIFGPDVVGSPAPNPGGGGGGGIEPGQCKECEYQ
jgi:hypothetical protein